MGATSLLGPSRDPCTAAASACCRAAPPAAAVPPLPYRRRPGQGAEADTPQLPGPRRVAAAQALQPQDQPDTHTREWSVGSEGAGDSWLGDGVLSHSHRSPLTRSYPLLLIHTFICAPPPPPPPTCCSKRSTWAPPRSPSGRCATPPSLGSAPTPVSEVGGLLQWWWWWWCGGAEFGLSPDSCECEVAAVVVVWGAMCSMGV